MTTWEYEITVFSRFGEEGSEEQQENIMNMLGEDGWELVSVAVQCPDKAFAYFRRSKGTI